MTTKEVMSWGEGQWRANLKYASPSKGGAVGVMFCWCRNPSSSGPDYSKSSSADFVLKPISGSAAPAKFAEHFLGKTVGARGVNTDAIVKGTPVYNTIIQLLTGFKNSLTASVQAERNSMNAPLSRRMGKIMSSQEANYAERTGRQGRPIEGDELLNRWNAVWNNYAIAEAFLVQETLQGIREFGDVYRQQHGLRQLLLDKALMTNMGKLFAADAIIGNGDRLFEPNMGNVVFLSDGTVCSIDSATILSNYQAILDATNKMDTLFAVTNADQWSKEIVTGKGTAGGMAMAAPTSAQVKAYNPMNPTPVLPPAFGMSMLFDVDKWWNDVFRPHLQKGMLKESQLQQAKGGPPLPPPLESDWSSAQANFKVGVDEGIKNIDSQLSGFNWMSVKSKYKGYVTKYGGDPNLDWTNFKVRRLYFKSRKRGKSDAEAMAIVNDYVKKKYPGI